MTDVRTDDELMDAARDGEEGAFAALYRRHRDVARREAQRRCGRRDAADDAVAAAFASVFGLLRRGGGPTESFRAYLVMAVRNALIDQARRDRGASLPLDGLEDVAITEIVDVEDSTLGDAMGSALRGLPARQREALWRTEVEGWSSTEIARRMCLSDNAFAALKRRARRNLCDAYVRAVGSEAPRTLVAA